MPSWNILKRFGVWCKYRNRSPQSMWVKPRWPALASFLQVRCQSWLDLCVFPAVWRGIATFLSFLLEFLCVTFALFEQCSESLGHSIVLVKSLGSWLKNEELCAKAFYVVKLWRLSFQVSMPTSPCLALQQDTNGTAASWTSAIASMARASRVKSSDCHPILCSIQATTSRRKWKRSKILTLRSMAVMFIWNIDAYCILNMYRHIWDWLRWRPLSYEGSRNCRSIWDFWKKFLRLLVGMLVRWTLQVSFEDWEFWIYISQSQLRCRDFGFSKARSLTQRVHLPMFSVIFSNLGILVFSRATFRDPTICGKEMECFYTITGVKEGPDYWFVFLGR